MAIVLATDAKGLKRICLNCDARYYDMNKRPIICPNCGTEFVLETRVKSRRARPVNEIEDDTDIPPRVNDLEEDDTLIAEDDTLVSLDEVVEDTDDTLADSDEAEDIDTDDVDITDIDDEDLETEDLDDDLTEDDDTH